MKFAIMLSAALCLCCASLVQAATTKSHKVSRNPPHHVAVTKQDRDYRSHYRFPMHHGDDY